MKNFPGDVRGHSRRRAQRERDLEAELDAHLDLETLDGIDRGLEPEAARLAAQRTLGSRSAIQDHVRDVWRWALVGQMWQDIRYAVRTLRRTPLWTAAALIALGLGVGANAAIFSLADALLFRPLAIAAPGRVLTISTATPESGAEGLSYSSSTISVVGRLAQRRRLAIGWQWSAWPHRPTRCPRGGCRWQ